MDKFRRQVPALLQRVNGKPLTYFNSAATTFAAESVIQTMLQTMTHHHSSVHRGITPLDYCVTEKYEEARERLAGFIGGKASEFIFTSGTTQGLNLIASCAGRLLGRGDVVLLTTLEHHSHLLPWQQIAKERGFQVKYVDIDCNGRVSLEQLERLLREGGVRVIAFSMISNVLGTVQPIIEIVELAKQYNAYVVLDAAQAVGHYPLDVQKLGVGAIAFGAHKMYGPAGIGGVWVHSDWLSQWEPYMVGGGMISTVSFHAAQFLPSPHRFEAGTPNLAGAMGMAAAADWLADIGWGNIIAKEDRLTEYLAKRLTSLSSLRLLCHCPNIPLFSFVVNDVHAHDIGTALGFEGIVTRAGHHCAQPLHDQLKVEASTRISLSFLNTIEECDVFMEALQHIITHFQDAR